MDKNPVLNSLLSLKQKFFYFLLYDLLFFLSFFIFFIFVRLKLYSYQLRLEEFGSQLGTFTADNLDPFVLQQVLDQVNAIANRALLFIYIAVPLGIFLIWVIFQGSSWQLLSGKKRFDFKYLIRFAVATLPFFIALGFIIIRLFNLLSELLVDYSILFRIDVWIYIIIAVLIFYLTLIIYSDLNFKNILKNIKTAFKKIYVMFPIALIFVVLFFALFLPLTYLYLLFFAGIYTLNIAMTLILFFVFLLLFSYCRIFIFAFFNKSLKESK